MQKVLVIGVAVVAFLAGQVSVPLLAGRTKIETTGCSVGTTSSTVIKLGGEGESQSIEQGCVDDDVPRAQLE